MWDVHNLRDVRGRDLMCAMRMLSVVLAGLVLSFAAHADEAPTANPRRLLLMVQYLGTDYPNAVSDGKVLDQAEYDEAALNAQEAVRMYRAVVPQGALDGKLVALQKLVEKKAAAPLVENAVAELVPELTKQLKLNPVPVDIPDLALGKQKFEALCSACHGMTGKGDGPAAASLKPPPAIMADKDWADAMAPFQIFNTITMGLPGTAMASFAADLTVEERWSVAFHVMTLRQPASPAALDARLPVRELATSSNQVLAARLRKDDPKLSPDAALAIVDGARRKMPPVPTVEEAMNAMSHAAEQSPQVVQQHGKERALELIRNTYMDTMEPVEKPLRRDFPDEVAAMEAAVTALRKGISAGEPIASAVENVQRTTRALRERHAQGPAPAPAAPDVDVPVVDVPVVDATEEEPVDLSEPHRVAGVLGIAGLLASVIIALVKRPRR